MDQVERSATSVEEAVDAALAELGITEQEARIQVLQEPKSGFLGLKSQPALVRVSRIPADGVSVDEQADVAADFLEGLMERVGFEAEVDINEDRGVTYIEIWAEEQADDVGLLIGKHGAVLDALQELVRVAVQRETGERCRVIVDVEDYRKRRRDQLVRRAQEVARRVQRSGEPEALEPMTALERKIVHDAVGEVGGVQTASEGEEPNRRVVVSRA